MPYTPTIASFFTDSGAYLSGGFDRTRTGVSSCYDRNHTINTLTTTTDSTSITTSSPRQSSDNSTLRQPEEPRAHVFLRSLRHFNPPKQPSSVSPHAGFMDYGVNLTKRGFNCFKTGGITPYLCLPGKLSQVCFNKVTLILILLAVIVQLFGSLLMWSLQAMESYEATTCLSVTTNFEIQSLLSSSTVSMNTLEINNINSTLVNSYEYILGQMELLEMGYSGAVLNSINAAASAATNATTSIVQLVNTDVDAANKTVSSELETLKSALEALESTLKDTDLFSSNGLGPSVTNISLEPFYLEIPSSISSSLLSSNSSVAQKQIQSLLNDVKSNAIMDVKKDFADYYNRVAKILATSSNITGGIAGTASGSCDAVSTYYGGLISSVGTNRRNGLIVLLVLAIIAIFPAGMHAIYAWRRQLEICLSVETNADSNMDFMSFISEAKSPIIWRLSSILDHERLNLHQKTRTLMHWLISCLFSPSALFLLLVSSSTMLLYICEKVILRGIVRQMNDKVAISRTTATNTGYSNNTIWRTALDGMLQTFQTDINNNVTELLSDVAQKTYDSLNSFAQDLHGNASGILKKASIPTPGISYSVSSAITYATLQYPVYDDALSSNTTAITGAFSNEYGLDSLLDEFSYITDANLTISVVLLGVWLLMLLLNLHYAAYKRFQGYNG